MKTKFIKVSVSERLPEQGKYYCQIKNREGRLIHQFYYPDETVFQKQWERDVEFWLEEVPDREEEMREMLERIYNIENKEFGKSSFNIEDLKRKIKRVLES